MLRGRVKTTSKFLKEQFIQESTERASAGPSIKLGGQKGSGRPRGKDRQGWHPQYAYASSFQSAIDSSDYVERKDNERNSSNRYYSHRLRMLDGHNGRHQRPRTQGWQSGR